MADMERQGNEPETTIKSGYRLCTARLIDIGQQQADEPMSDIDHTPCIQALERLQATMNAAIDRANEQIAATQARLDQLDRTNEALAKTQLEMIRQIRNLLESGRTSDALRYVVALSDATT